MVLTRNLYPKRRAKQSSGQLLKNYKLEKRLVKSKRSSALKFTIKHGNFTSCDITLPETSINNKILRIQLENYDFRVLRNISCDLNISSFGRNKKRKRNSTIISDSQRPHKKLRINGSSLEEARRHLTSSVNNHISHSNTSTKKEKYKDSTVKKRITHSKATKKKEQETLDKINVKSPSTFDKSKFKIRLSPKNIKSNEKKVINKSQKNINKESTRTKDKLHNSTIVQKTKLHNPTIVQKAKLRDPTIQKTKLHNPTIQKTKLHNPTIIQKTKLHNPTIVQKTVETKDSCATHTYYLKFKREKLISDGRLNYHFQKLVTDVKNMNLPTASWKIKVIIKQNKIAAITFTNKQQLERSVTFSSDIDYYKLCIDNKSAFLLGSPETIDTPEDIEILLDIVETLDSSSPVILYR